MKNGKFEVGDVVKGKSNPYSITDKAMTKGEVLDVQDDDMLLKIVSHPDEWIGDRVWVKNNTRYFELIKDEQSPINEAGKIQKTLFENFTKYIYKVESKLKEMGYYLEYSIELNEIMAIAIKNNDVAVISRARCHPKDIYVEEVGKAIALERIMDFLNKK